MAPSGSPSRKSLRKERSRSLPPRFRGRPRAAAAGGGVSGAFPGRRASADVRVHRTSSDEAKTPSKAAERIRARQPGAFATKRAGPLRGRGTGERPIPRGRAHRNSFRRKFLPDTWREQHPGKEAPRPRTTKLPATLKSRVLFSVKISMGREENPVDEKRWSISPIRDTRLRIPFGGHHPSSGEKRMVEEKGIEPSTPTLRTWCSPN